MSELSLQAVLEAFGAPLTEEQAWALCYQCTAKLLKDKSHGDRSTCQEEVTKTHSRKADNDGHRRTLFNTRSVSIGLDGTIISLGDFSTADKLSSHDDSEVIHSLGIVLFQALDFGLSEAEEQLLSEQLGELIERMTNVHQPPSDEHDGTDEGIVDDGGFDKESLSGIETPQQLTLHEILRMCGARVDSTEEAAVHYKAVCRALVAEAIDLTSFLEKINNEREQLKSNAVGSDQLHHLESLQRTDWARLWIQIMKELRTGVKLKKVQTKYEKRSIEYELTPYEILMDDLRFRRYTLNKVPDDEKLAAAQVKKDVHDIILEFIRSRPPLHPVSDRKLCSPPPVLPDPREQLLKSLREKHRLKPTPVKYLETSRTRLDDKDETMASVPRKIIKADLSLLVSNSFDDELDSTDYAFEEKSRIVAEPFTSFTPLSPKSPPKQHLPWQRAVDSLADSSERRHSITRCLSPVTSPKQLNDPQSRFDSIWSQVDKFMAADFSNIMMMPPSVECLSLTVEEVMHIRSVLTKAELECIVIEPELYYLLVNGKICFSCKKTRFGPFGLWSTTCKFCCRNVCSKCISKMQIPTEHFEHIPVYTLSPGSPADRQHVDTTTGSAPSSPTAIHKSPPSTAVDAAADNGSSPTGLAAQLMSTLQSRQQQRGGRGLLQRSQTVIRGPPSAQSPANPITGPLMNVCRDCRTMIANIVRASRQILSQQSGASSQSATDRVYSNHPQRRPASASARNFHLDLKPVYRTK